MKRVEEAADGRITAPSFWEAAKFWIKLGFISFGGPTGQIAILHTEVVERRRWISEARFLHALNYCMLLPGPEAQQLATYVGWLLHRTWGGILAGAAFVIPSMLILWALSYIYVAYGEITWISAFFYGLKPAVLAIVAHAVIRIGSKTLKNEVMWSLAAAAFVAIYFFGVAFPVIVLAAGMIGFMGGKLWREKFLVIKGHGAMKSASLIDDDAEAAEHTRPTFGRAFRILSVCLALWWGPIWLLAMWLGWDHTILREGVFFSKAAMVTFGGAYAVLPYVSQQAVDHYGWLSAGQMLDGLGLAETTPGPLIMVLQFVGFLGGWNHPGPLSPLAAATIGSFVSTWATFLPCFLWIFLGAPHIEQMRGNERLSSTLSAVSAAVVGVVLNLAVWFGVHALWPGGGRLDWFAVIVCVVTLIGLVRWKWDVMAVVALCGIAGVLFQSFG